MVASVPASTSWPCHSPREDGRDWDELAAWAAEIAAVVTGTPVTTADRA
jgi:hypothetical protein